MIVNSGAVISLKNLYDQFCLSFRGFEYLSPGAMISADEMCGVEIEPWVGAAVKMVMLQHFRLTSCSLNPGVTGSNLDYIRLRLGFIFR